MFGRNSGGDFHFEVLLRKEGRWQLDIVLGEDLNKLGRSPTEHEIQKVEDAAVARAKGQLATGDYTAARVTREQTGAFGHRSVREIFNEEATVKKAERMVPQPYKGGVPVWTSIEDLTRRPACHVFGAVFRDFLNKFGITALEAIHLQPHFRRLEDAGTMLQGGLHLIAMRQAEFNGGGVSGRQRASALQDLVQKAANKARDAQAMRNLPALRDDDIENLYQRIGGLYDDPFDQRYHTVVAVGRELLGQQSHLARLELGLKLLPGAIGPEGRAIVDELIAGCLDMPAMIMELLGTRNSLAEALLVLAALSRGAFDPIKDSNPLTPKLAAAIATGNLPAVVESLWDRIAREAAGPTPLVRNDKKREWTETLRLSDMLVRLAPPDLSHSIKNSLEQRLDRLRERPD